MPGLDRTGPEGQGSQTGRRLGKCNPENQDKPQWNGGSGSGGRGLGRRPGRGKGRRFRGGTTSSRP